jgi:hypothetical protein
MIRKFNEMSTEDKIELVRYINLGSSNLPDDVHSEFMKWAEIDGHSNGYATRWYVERDPYYKLINQYLIDCGVKLGEFVIVHDSW